MSKSFLEIKPLCFHEERFYAFWDDVHPPKWICYHCEYDKTSAAYTEAIKLCDEMAAALKNYDGAYRQNWAVDFNELTENGKAALDRYNKFKEINK